MEPLSVDRFLAHIETALDMEPNSLNADLTPFEQGIDSSLIIEVVLAIEELGVEVPDDLDWPSATIRDLYQTYRVALDE